MSDTAVEKSSNGQSKEHDKYEADAAAIAAAGALAQKTVQAARALASEAEKRMALLAKKRDGQLEQASGANGATGTLAGCKTDYTDEDLARLNKQLSTLQVPAVFLMHR